MSKSHFYFENVFKIWRERNSTISKADLLAKQKLSERKIQGTEGLGGNGYRMQIKALILKGGKHPIF